MGSFGNRATKQAGCENGQLREHTVSKRYLHDDVEFFERGTNWFVRGRIPVMQCRIMSPSDKEKAGAQRAIAILYIGMIIGIGLPIVLYFALR
jgi:hypothetical protein